MKKCQKCGAEKDFSEFYKSSHHKDDLHSWCKDCHSRYNAERDNEPQWDAIRRCGTCQELKPGTAFYPNHKNALGLSYNCKECQRAVSASYREKYAAQEKPVVVSKVCSGCGEDKPASDYYKAAVRKDGLYSRCKPCHLSYSKARRESKKGFSS